MPRSPSPPARSTSTRRSPGTLAETVAAIEAVGGKAVAIAADLADGDDRARIVPEVEAALGPVDILVNNAAAAFYLPTADFPLKRRRLLFEINVHAPIDLAQAVLPGMHRAGGAGSSTSRARPRRARKGPPFDAGVALGATTTGYGASKAALERFTAGLAAEVQADGVAVNSLAPVAACAHREPRPTSARCSTPAPRSSSRWS